MSALLTALTVALLSGPTPSTVTDHGTTLTTTDSAREAARERARENRADRKRITSEQMAKAEARAERRAMAKTKAEREAKAKAKAEAKSTRKAWEKRSAMADAKAEREAAARTAAKAERALKAELARIRTHMNRELDSARPNRVALEALYERMLRLDRRMAANARRSIDMAKAKIHTPPGRSEAEPASRRHPVSGTRLRG